MFFSAPPILSLIAITFFNLTPSVSTFLTDCGYQQKLETQVEIPFVTSKLRKCCPEGKSFSKNNKCEPHLHEFFPEIISVEFYEGCIKNVTNQKPRLDIQVGFDCKESQEYSASEGDHLLVIQNGSLLMFDIDNSSINNLQTDYCLDTRYDTGELYALVCVYEEQKFKTLQAFISASSVLISISSLCLVTFLHIFKKELRSVHGLSLGVMCACLAMGFTLHTIEQIFKNDTGIIDQLKSFFILAYFCWLLCLCGNVALHVLYYMPGNILKSQGAKYLHFISFALFSFWIPISIVYFKTQNKMPSLMDVAFHDFTWIPGSQKYYILPIALLLFFSLMLLFATYNKLNHLYKMQRLYGDYQKVQATSEAQAVENIVNVWSLNESKKDTKSICYLFIITTFTWFLEILNYYRISIGHPCFKNVINALQGVLILLIFIFARHGRKGFFWQKRSESSELKRNQSNAQRI